MIPNKFNWVRKILFLAALLIFWQGWFCVAHAAGASLFLFPPSGTYGVGENFNVYVKVDCNDTPINAAEGVLVFNPGELEVVSVSKTGSFFTLWTKDPVFSNPSGKIEFGGGTQNAFSNSSGTILTIVFKAKISASSQVNFSSGSVLAADGLGTNILGAMQGGIYTFSVKNTGLNIAAEDNKNTTGGSAVLAGQIIPPGAPEAPVITSTTHPEEEKWYANGSPELAWIAPPGITGARAILDHDLVSLPNVTYPAKSGKKSFSNLDDGAWYFHLQFKNDKGWGSIGHRKVLIDTQPPPPFAVAVDNQNNAADPSPALIFDAKDAVSGIGIYEIKIDQNETVKVLPEAIKEAPYHTPVLPPGNHMAIVKAIDRAGNMTLGMAEFLIAPINCPLVTEMPASINEKEAFTLKGTSSNPDAAILVIIRKDGGEIQRKEISTDSDGSWGADFPAGLSQGDYQASVQMTDRRGGQTGECNKLNFSVNERLIIKIGSLIINYSSIVLILTILLILLIALVVYAWYRILAWRRKLKRETDESDQVTSNAFEVLRQEVEREIEFIDSLPGVTEQEKKVRDNLKKSLDDSETLIHKEINDIERELK